MGLRQPSMVRSPGHLAWVRGHECCIAGKNPTIHPCDPDRPSPMPHVCEGKMEAHHVREGSNGGVGMKPDDSTAVPLCSYAHKRGHDRGWKSFEAEWRVDLTAIAEQLWKASPHRKRYEAKIQEKQGGSTE